MHQEHFITQRIKSLCTGRICEHGEIQQTADTKRMTSSVSLICAEGLWEGAARRPVGWLLMLLL